MSAIPEYTNEFAVLAGLLSGTVAKFAFGAVTRHNRRKHLAKVGAVSQLYCYPIKSCRGIPVDDVFCTPLGVQVGRATDRHWMVVRSNGDFVTQRQASKLALVTPEICQRELVITAPNMPVLTVPLEPVTDRSKVMRCRVWEERTEGMDCGDDAAYWFSIFLKIDGLRLVFAAPDLSRKDVTCAEKPGGNPALPGDQVAFSDWASYLVISEGSLAILNERLDEPVPMTRFRPNIVVKECPAFDEDGWSELQIGDSTFRMLGPCERCVVTTINPDTGERDPEAEPLTTLRSFRCVPKHGASPLFGVNATADTSGIVRVGDFVYAIQK